MSLPSSSSPTATLVRWLREAALPLWADAGWDASQGMFVEKLDATGAPINAAPRRAMVQARQIFVFCLAERRGWSRGFGDALARSAENFVRRFHAADGMPGWIFSVDRFGQPVDRRRDLYGHAFVLLALASLARTTGDRHFLALADQTLTFLDRFMACPAGGYVDALPHAPPGHLRQNPHMHLFEALLALHEASPEGDYMARAERLARLMTGRFLRDGVLIEHFEADWTPRGGPDFPFEPGHHFEWAWLLTRFSALGGKPSPEAAALWQTAVVNGLGPDGTIFDEVSLARGAVQRSTRLWPYAEAARAAGLGFGSTDERLSPNVFLAHLHDRFLVPAVSGSWIDHFDAQGQPKTDFAPASSLYHIIGAVDDISRDRRGRDIP